MDERERCAHMVQAPRHFLNAARKCQRHSSTLFHLYSSNIHLSHFVHPFSSTPFFHLIAKFTPSVLLADSTTPSTLGAAPVRCLPPPYPSIMLSRTLLRPLPRTSARIAQCPYSTRSLVNSALRSSIRQQTPRTAQWISRATFSSSSRHFDNVSQELAVKLTNEIALEEENTEAQADSDASVKRFLGENDFWSLEAPEGSQDVLLRRQYDDELITVGFSIVDFNSTAIPLDADEADDSFLDEEEEIAREQSGGANSKGAINQGGSKNPNFKLAPEDSIAPADREDMMNEDVCSPSLYFPRETNSID